MYTQQEQRAAIATERLVGFVFGVPIGVFLAAHLSWQVPFLALAGLSSLIWSIAARFLPSIRVPLAEADEHPVAQMLKVLSRKDHHEAFLLSILMTGSGFLVFPYLSNYMIANVGVKETDFPLIYLCGGFYTIFSMILIGRWADRAGKPRVFCIVSWLAIASVLTLTNLPRVPVTAALAITTFFMVCISGRSAPAMALITRGIEARYGGSFMSLNSSIQQFTSGVVAYLGGLIIGKSATGEMTHFPLVGAVATGCALLSICLVRSKRLTVWKPSLNDCSSPGSIWPLCAGSSSCWNMRHAFFRTTLLVHRFGDWYSNAAPDFGWAGTKRDTGTKRDKGQRGTGQIREKVEEDEIGIGIAGATS